MLDLVKSRVSLKKVGNKKRKELIIDHPVKSVVASHSPATHSSGGCLPGLPHTPLRGGVLPGPRYPLSRPLQQAGESEGASERVGE